MTRPGDLPATALAGQIVTQALCLGLLTGLGEVALLTVKQRVMGQFIRFGPDVLWMAPIADAAAFLLIGLVLIALGRGWPLMRRPVVVTFVFGFLACYTALLMYYPLHPIAKVVLAVGLAAQTARLLGRRYHGFSVLARRTLAVAAALVILLAAVARLGPAWAYERRVAALPAPAAGSPNVLLIVLDTVRADHFGLYGYPRQTTPHLERWAESATVFERAMSTSPWTLPSHASMLTGQWAHDLSATWETALGPEHRTLAEALGARGYVSGGFIGNTYYCGHELGLARGFSRYDDYVASWRELVISSTLVRRVVNGQVFRRATGYEDNLPRRSAEEITDQFLDWQSTTGERPFFAFLNYFDAHETYLPPPPFDSQFGPGPPGGGPAVVQDLRRSLRFDWRQRPRGEIDAEINMYDGAIAYLDQQLDRLFRMLQARGVLDETIVIVTSDHGEEFGEHGLFLHGNSLYQPLLHVPLVIRYPSRMPAGVRVPDRVSLRDLPATIEDLLGTASSFPGRSLAREWSAPASDDRQSEPALAEVRQAIWAAEWASSYPAAKGDMASISDDAYHYIRNGDGTEELYAAADREERENLAARDELRPILERYRAMLRDAGVRSRRD